MHKSEGGAARLNEGESKWRGGLAVAWRKGKINPLQRMERRLEKEKEPPGSAVGALSASARAGDSALVCCCFVLSLTVMRHSALQPLTRQTHPLLPCPKPWDMARAQLAPSG